MSKRVPSPIDAALWAQVEPVFDRAVELAGAERRRYLVSIGADRPEVREQVERLLAAEEQAGSLLERPAVPFRAGLVAGAHLGPYRLVRELGRGGMSEVWLAEREQPFRQTVALKVMHSTTAHRAEAERRFRAERQILAQLEHPNIARIVDGGETERGHLFLAMEWVDGEQLNEYVERTRPTLRERLRLFVEICNAVQFAHRYLVVHRDIKPSNVLVDSAGRPKLVDFGIAKLLDPALLLDQTLPNTRHGLLLMTPEYAAPEQLLGTGITTLTDVYQLGLLLYELVAGHRPYDLADRTPSQLQELICERLPEPPSTRRGARRQAGGLPIDDLDTVVLTALEKEPERRYGSAKELAADIERILLSEPIAARPPSTGYRLRLFVRRNLAGVLAAAVLASVLAGSAVLLLLAQRSTARERDRAQSEAAKSEQVIELLLSLFEASDPQVTGGAEPTVRELLERGSDRLEQWQGDESTEAALRGVMGRAYFGIGQFERAAELLRQAVAQRRQTDGPSFETAASMSPLVQVLRDLGEFDEGESVARESLALMDENGKQRTTEYAHVLSDLGLILQSTDREEEALETARRALSLRQELLPENDERIGDSLNDVGLILMNQGNFEEADQKLEEAFELTRRAFPDGHPDLAITLDNWAQVRARTGDFESAEELFRESIDLRRRLSGPDHPMIATTLNNLAITTGLGGDWTKAAELQREVLEFRRRTLPAGSLRIGRSLCFLGASLARAGQAEEAIPYFEQSLEILEEKDRSSTLDDCKVMLANALEDAGRPQEAARLREAASHGSESPAGPQ